MGQKAPMELATLMTVAQSEKERIRRLYEQEAPIYDRAMRAAERILLGGAREWVGRRARGEVLEIAVGTGRNLPYYAADVRLTGIDLSPAMLDVAKRRAASLRRDAHLRLGDAEQLEYGDETFDTVVCTYSLCTISDDVRAVGEMQRVLRSGGTLLLAEHVRSPVGIIHAAQRALEPLAVRHAADHLLREPLELVRAEGLLVEELERHKLGIVQFLAASKPANRG
jgi:ubiquinone/menaquinone biosynthesis C-methylase UbiE